MQVWQIIIITLISFLKKVDHKGFQIAIYNSMFWGSLTGLVMGDFNMGLCIGGTFQLMSLGVTAIGGASVPDYQIGAIISTAIAVSTGEGMEFGIAIGLPVAMVCIQLDVIMNLLDGYLVRKSQTYCSQGDFKRMNRALLQCIVVTGLSTALPTFVAAAFGPSVVHTLIDFLPHWFLPGLAVSGKILPVCGIAALLRYMPTKRYFEYLLFGFVLSAYLKVPILGVTLVGIGLAHMLYKKKMRDGIIISEVQEDRNSGSDTESFSVTLNAKELKRAGWRWNIALECFNYENQMAGGVVYALSPALRRIYQEDEDYKQALDKHFNYFNITPWLGGFILGVVLRMEERGKLEAKDAIQNMKVGLMGAISGFGDSIFFILIPTIFGSIGGYMALDGNPVGMAAWLMYGLVLLFIRPQLVLIGYHKGLKIANEFGNRLNVYTEAASALGLAVVGSMITTVVTVKTPLTFVSGEVVKEIQPILDSILPSMIAVILTGAVMWLLKKKIKLSYIIYIIIVGSCICTSLGILA